MTPLELGFSVGTPSLLAGMLFNHWLSRATLNELRRQIVRSKVPRLPPEEGGEYEAYPAQDKKHPLTVYLGEDERRNKVYVNFGRFPHMIVAGLSGGGKSNLINHFICQLLARPASKVNLCLIDMKEGIEFSWYEGVRHLAHNIAHTPEDALAVLDWLEQERQRRQQLIKAAKCKKLDEYNARSGAPIPYLVVVVDEIADLIAEDKSSADKLAKLGRLARSAGIHMILATQYPKADIVSTNISVNCGGRVAFRLNNQMQSRVILDNPGAEELKGKGQGLFTHEGITRRVQTPFVPDEVVLEAVEKATPPKLKRVA